MDEIIFDKEFFQKLSTLKLLMKTPLDTGMGGSRKSMAKGSSVEFSDFREYILGDDIRRVDWNAYGRMDKLFVKLFMEEKEGLFRIMVDLSKSMDYGSKKKSVTALRIAGLLSYMILHNLDRVVMTALREDQSETTKGMTGSQSFQKLLSFLSDLVFQGETDLEKSIRSQPIHGRGVCILISDFFDPNGLDGVLKYLSYQKQEIYLFHVLAQEEQNPQQEGYVNLIDSETGDQLKVSMNSKVIGQYQEALLKFTSSIKESARRYGAGYIPVTAGEALDGLLVKIGKAGIA